MAGAAQTEGHPHGFRPLLIEMLFIFVGVTAAFLVDDYRERREASARAVLLAGAIHRDIGDNRRVWGELAVAMDAGLEGFEAQVAMGRRPVPYVLEISGSLRPPSGVWESAGTIGLRDFADPALLFELSRFYNEAQGVADNFVRYSEFTERAFWPVALSDSAGFYGEDGRLLGEFQAHLQQMRDYRSDIARQMEWGAELRERLRTEFPGLESESVADSAIYGSVVRRR